MQYNRVRTVTTKVPTAFGSMYIHINYDDQARPVGASISTPGKAPESQIEILIQALSDGLNEALQL